MKSCGKIIIVSGWSHSHCIHISVIQAVKLTSSRTQLPYEYYSLPFCKPQNVVYKGENLGKRNMGWIVCIKFWLNLIFCYFSMLWFKMHTNVILQCFLFSFCRWSVTWGPYCEYSIQHWNEQGQEMWDCVQQDKTHIRREQTGCTASPGGVLCSPVSVLIDVATELHCLNWVILPLLVTHQLCALQYCR